MALSIQREANQVIFEESVGTRKVILNRPKKLNTLNYEMLRQMLERLKVYENDPTVKLVILKANGKVFCVGGDLTSAFTFVNVGHWSFAASYYRKEFCLDFKLATYKKPLVTILNGSVMGGGAGISMHSTFKIVTENTVFAMPEALIGLFPDVGASYFLSRLPGFLGEYMGMTGARLNGAEMIASGLGTHFIPSQDLFSLENALETVVVSSHASSLATISAVINKFTEEISIGEETVLNRLDIINECFSRDSCEEILSSLEHLAMEIQEKWINDAITSMKSASPLGLKIFLKTIRKGRSQNLQQCLENEYIAISHVLRKTIGHDFYEGTRAMLIDKDKKPQWVPSKLEEVSDEMVEKCFSRVFGEDDDWEPLRLQPRSDETYAKGSRL